MKQFDSIKKLDIGILYFFELAASLSVILLMFGIVASMANVLTGGTVLTDNKTMQIVWAWTQCIAIDASIAGTIRRTYSYFQQKDWTRFWLYMALSIILLFTAAIVLNVEAMQQTLNLTLDAAYSHVFLSVESLIWVRSIAIILLVVAHALRHVDTMKAYKPATVTDRQQPTVRTVRVGKRTQMPAQEYENAIREYLITNPNATIRGAAKDLGFSSATAGKYLKKIREENHIEGNHQEEPQQVEQVMEQPPVQN